MTFNMFNCLIDVCNHPHGQNRSQKLRAPVLLGGSNRAGHQLPGASTTANFNTFSPILGNQTLQYLFSNRFCQQQGFHCATYTVTPALGIKGNGDSLVDIRCAIDVNMAVSIEMFNYGYCRFTAHPFDKATTTTWHNDIDKFRHPEQLTHHTAVGVVEHLYGRHRQACRLQAFLQVPSDGEVRSNRLTATPQNGGIPRFKT